MPWEIEKRGDEYCVVKRGGELVKCHADEDEANAHLKALYASEKKKTARSLIDRLLGRKPEPTAFKVVGNRWVIVWSNNFEDRDGELFSDKALSDYVKRVETGVVPMPELWVYHHSAGRVGTAQGVGKVGHFVVAAGEFDDTARGRKARDYYARHHRRTSISHGFTFPVWGYDAATKTYTAFNTFEYSLLPRGAEANRFTSLEGVKAAMREMSEKTLAYFKEVLGEEGFREFEAELQERGKALEDMGIRYKDTPDMGDPDPEPVEEDDDEDTTELAGLVADLLSDNGELVKAIKAVKEASDQTAGALADEVKALSQQVKALSEQLESRPRTASEDPDTLVKDVAVEKAAKEQFLVRDPFTGLLREER